jgi:uncharacterized membrane protein YfcA
MKQAIGTSLFIIFYQFWIWICRRFTGVIDYEFLGIISIMALVGLVIGYFIKKIDGSKLKPAWLVCFGNGNLYYYKRTVFKNEKIKRYLFL